MSDKLIVDLNNKIKEAENMNDKILFKTFREVSRMGINNIYIANDKFYKAEYAFGKLEEPIYSCGKLTKIKATYGILFYINIDGEDYYLTIPVDESFINSDGIDKVIEYAFEVFEEKLEFQLKCDIKKI